MKVQRYFREWEKLQLVEGVLYRMTVIDGEKRKQPVVSGKEKTLWLARQKYFWPSVAK
jgi:hypothetical protein